MNFSVAKQSLDRLIQISRVHLYKPIQVAEILYRDRVYGDIDFNILDSYRNASKKWRDEVSVRLVGRRCTSSAKYQDNLFDNNAIPPSVLVCLADYNKKHCGIVEAYIYNCFSNRFSQMATGLNYCYSHGTDSFNIKEFIDLFWYDKGLRRSIDKIYEIVVYALFSALIESLRVEVTISSDLSKMNLLKEFSDFTERVIGISPQRPSFTINARINRVGVTNASDRGLDVWANFGMAIQVKHLSLTEELAEGIVQSVTSDRIVIICKDSEEKLIVSLLNQIGWKSKIQSIVTENDLIAWYEKALRGTFSNELGINILQILQEQIQLEFPSTDGSSFQTFQSERGYNMIDLTLI